MKVRTQLIVAFLLLAVLPLTGIVLYSYLTSRHAFREAVEVESRRLADEMGERLEAVRTDVRDRLENVAQLPVRALLPSDSGADASEVYADLMAQMGDVATLVDWLEFTPVEGAGDLETPEPFFIYPSKTLAEALQKIKEKQTTLEESGISQEYLEATIRQAIRERRQLKDAELAALEARDEEVKLLLGAEFTAPVLRGETVIGELKVLVPPSQILQQVLSRTPRDGGEVPYARDNEGNVYVDRKRDKGVLAGLGVPIGEGETAQPAEDWIIVEKEDSASGLTFGVARPIQESLRGFRNTAVRNFAYGLAMVFLAMAGVVWLSSRMTRNLYALTVGAERLAAGDLEARVPLRSRDEFGMLAVTLNRMASELSENQARLLREERLRKEQEIQQRLLAAENERKSRELEEAREFQLSLLPKALPNHPDLELAVLMRTATEVGGDYYDFFPSPEGTLTTAIGDAAGHGVRAGTMVTVVKGLFSAGAADDELSELLEDTTRAIKNMGLGRMNMGVSLVRIDGRRMTVSTAGMPPVLLYRRRSQSVEEVALAGTPLGSFADVEYQSWRASPELAPGDTILLMTDGFPELLNPEGDPFGYSRVRSLFAEVAEKPPHAIIGELTAAADSWNGGRPPDDDMTFVVLKVRDAAPASA